MRQIWGENLERLSPSDTMSTMEDGMPRKKVSKIENTVRNICRRSCKKYSGEQVFEIIVTSVVIERGPLQL
jgi:hypothetical protein